MAKTDELCPYCGNDKFFITVIGGSTCITCDKCRRIKIVISPEDNKEGEDDGDVW